MAVDALKQYLRSLPTTDRVALERALDVEWDDEVFDLTSDCQGLAAHWSSATRLNYVGCYTYWLAFLSGRGELDADELPSARASRVRLLAFLKSYGHRSPQTRLSYLNALIAILKVIDPAGDLAYIYSLRRRLVRIVRPSRDQRNLLVSPSEMFYAGIERMERISASAHDDVTSASTFCDGLMLSAMACKALRRKNFASIVIGKNIRRNIMDGYEVSFSPVETKARRRIEAEWSKLLTPFIDQWLGHVRPVLLRGSQSDAMWITSIGTAMSAKTFYRRFCKVTHEELGLRINPHMTRKIVATGVAIARPELVRSVGSLLDQTSDQSAVYNLADQLSASESYIRILENRKAQTSRAIEPAASKR